jgi:solute carrier family 25 folate transporter 32
MTTKTITGSKATDQALAGFTAGAVSTLILHPLDLLKTKLQANELVHKRAMTVRILSTIFKQNGVKGFYVGVGPNFVGATASWGLYFFWYSHIKDALAGPSKAELSPAQHLGASALGGAIVSCFTNPIWVSKI